MATGARSCLWSIVGLTITACQAPRRISYRKTSRQSHEQLREPRAVSVTILFVLVPIGAIVAWWLSQQRLTAKPWLEVGAIGEVPDTGASSLPAATIGLGVRSEEHTSELQSLRHLVCRLLLEKKKKHKKETHEQKTNKVEYKSIL